MESTKHSPADSPPPKKSSALWIWLTAVLIAAGGAVIGSVIYLRQADIGPAPPLPTAVPVEGTVAPQGPALAVDERPPGVTTGRPATTTPQRTVAPSTGKEPAAGGIPLAAAGSPGAPAAVPPEVPAVSTALPTALPPGVPTTLPAGFPTAIPTALPTTIPPLPTTIPTALPTAAPTVAPAQ